MSVERSIGLHMHGLRCVALSEFVTMRAAGTQTRSKMLAARFTYDTIVAVAVLPWPLLLCPGLHGARKSPLPLMENELMDTKGGKQNFPRKT